MSGAAHGITGPTTTGAFTDPVVAPAALGGIAPVVKVLGLTVENTSTTSAATVIIRDAASSGKIVVAGTVPVQTGSVPGVLDIEVHRGRTALNGLYAEIDGGTIAQLTVWVC